MAEMNLWIDDEREAPAGYTHWATTPNEAVGAMSTKSADDVLAVVSFDHDMGINSRGEDVTSREVALWMIENEVYPETILIHSINPIGAKWLEDTLREGMPEDTVIVRSPYKPEDSE